MNWIGFTIILVLGLLMVWTLVRARIECKKGFGKKKK